MGGPRGELAVHINDGRTTQTVTARTRNLRWIKTAPGGFHSGSFTLDLPGDYFRDLGPENRVTVSDTRTGDIRMEGFTEQPGRTASPAGEGFTVAFMGTTVLAADQAQQFYYIDRDTGAWERANGAAPSANTSQSSDPDPSSEELAARDGLFLQFTPSQPIAAGAKAPMRNTRLEKAGFQVGAVAGAVKCGQNNTGYVVQLGSGTGVGGSASYNDLGTPGEISTTPATFTAYVGETDSPPAGDTRVVLRLRRTGGATNIGDDDTTWAYFYDLAVLGRRMTRDGTLVTGAAGMVTTTHVLAGWVVEDLIARALPLCNPTTADIATGDFPIDQLAYPTAVRPRQVLDDLLALEPDLHWGIGASSIDDARCAFWLRAWPTTPRYIVSTDDGWEETGSDTDLCNRIAVTWTDSKGQEQTEVVTSVVPALGSRVKDAEPVSVPDGLGSVSVAQRLGAAVLADKASPPRAGRVTVTRRVLDLHTGNYVAPWELEPGHLTRVREIGEDLRTTEVEYVDDDCAAVLTLGHPVLTPEQRVVRMETATGGYLGALRR